MKGTCFIHVPKCGGTSLVTSLRRAYGVSFFSRAYFHISPMRTLRKAKRKGIDFQTVRQNLLIKKLSQDNYRLIYGHVNCEENLRKEFEDRWNFITVLRNPEERWLSQYFYNKYKTSPHFKHSMEIDEYIQSDRGAKTGKAYLSYFGASAAEAIDNLEAFAVVGILEKPATIYDGFENKLDIELKRLKRKNRNPVDYNIEKILPEHHEIIAELCAEDMKIYNHFLKKSESQVSIDH